MEIISISIMLRKNIADFLKNIYLYIQVFDNQLFIQVIFLFSINFA